MFLEKKRQSPDNGMSRHNSLRFPCDVVVDEPTLGLHKHKPVVL